jgi:hypothetical protein
MQNIVTPKTRRFTGMLQMMKIRSFCYALSMLRRFLAFFFSVALAAEAADRIELIEFFGYEGIDLAAVRAALPVREGDVFDGKARAQVHEAVRSVTGADATDVASICCGEHGHLLLFIGLAGKSTHTFRLNASPKGSVRLFGEILPLFAKLRQANYEASKKGGDAAAEDDSEGYALNHYPPQRELQLQLRDYTRAHEEEIYDVLENCADVAQRQHTAVAAGYAKRSPRQIAALVRASHDVDAGVRDEATRAIEVLLRADASLAKQIPAADFIEMAGSGIWLDRNKASMVLDELTNARDPELLAQIEAQAWAALLEMSRWRDTGHAVSPRCVLGRIRKIPEVQLVDLAMGSPADFLRAVGVR